VKLPRRLSTLTQGERVAGKLRGALAGGLEVTCSPVDARRGESVTVTVTAEETGRELEVGLVCTETYASFMPTDKLTKSDRQLVDAIAYERWQAGESATFEIPAAGPYSYAGKHLSFTWRAAARQPARGLDPTRALELTVRP
jgi:hypothetical protein